MSINYDFYKNNSIDSSTSENLFDKISNKTTNVVNKIDKILNNNQNMIICTILIAGLIISYTLSKNEYKNVWILENQIFKFVLFVIVTLVSSKNICVGVIFGLVILVILQIVSNLKLKEELDKELDKEIDKQNVKEEFSCVQELDLTFVTPKQYYESIVSNGKQLVNLSLLLDKELKVTPNTEYEEISKRAKLDGVLMIFNGLNRLENADLGLYHTNYFSKDSVLLDFTNKFRGVLDLYNKHPDISYDYDKILDQVINLQIDSEVNLKLNPDEYIEQIDNIYKDKFILLKKIYEYKKAQLDPEYKAKISDTIDQINTSKKENKRSKWIEKISFLADLLV